MTSSESRVAIVTGASRGIGQAIAARLLSDGLRVVPCARTAVSMGAGSHAVALDLRGAGAGQAVVDEALGAFGRIDIVVNNAGATKRGDFEALTDEDWMDGFALKFFGAMRLTRAAWPYLRERAGAVVNIAGSGGRTPGAEFTIGGSVNAAMLSFTKALADLGVRDGVRVNAVNPGPVRTGRLDARLAETARVHGVDAAEALGIFVREEKIAQVAEPEDVAGLVAFLLSAQGRAMQGSLVDMDGGLTKTI